MRSDVPVVKPLSRKAIEETALRYVQRFSPSTLTGRTPFPIHRICEFQLQDICGVAFAVEHLPSGMEGRFEGAELIVDVGVYEDALAAVPRALFTLAHEFAHCILHKSQLESLNRSRDAKQALCRIDKIEPFRNPEWQANAFAAALLMPASAITAITEELNGRQQHWVEYAIKARLLVSQRAVDIRLETLKKMGVIGKPDPSKNERPSLGLGLASS